MTKNKIHSRAINPSYDPSSQNFFIRLATSQRFLAVIGLVFLVVILFPLARTYSQKRLIEKEIAEVKGQIDDYERQNEQLKELIQYLQSDQSLEEQARLNLNLKKPGEGVIVVEDKKTAVNETPVPSNSSTESNLAKWRDYIFN